MPSEAILHFSELFLFLFLNSLVSYSQNYPVQTVLKGNSVVILTTEQYDDVNLLMANQRARVNFYKNELEAQEKYMDSITKVFHEKIDSIDSLNEVLINRLEDCDSISTKLITMEQWLYERSVDNSYLYYSYLESTVKFIDLGSYVLYGTRRDGSFGLIRRGPVSEDLEWKKYNRSVKDEPLPNWESSYKNKWRPTVLTLPYKITPMNP
jgi:hypothetical protein